ncbi:hypothetical protein [Microtetraspora malaysiensis]|uniref:hypothetical protein n=1 Tax=Microtetraspora malaysiensis TaxID=161358 RepID=UPI003D8DC295
MASVGSTKYIEMHSWTICFGDVVDITAYLGLQKLQGGSWVNVAGPGDTHFAGVTGVKQYAKESVKCSAVGGSGTYRTKAYATWHNSDGMLGQTTTAYSSGAALTC